ncbi:MAG: hypothetical protein KJ984_01600 [Nanoarchaeota archaeon]|nr:hypothetical protein [Nanoarchaeota archaeon]
MCNITHRYSYQCSIKNFIYFKKSFIFMPEIHKYYCSKCGTKVKESDMKCPKCK